MPSTYLPQSTVNKPDVLVVGAGLAGLTAALHIAERGLTVQILEGDPEFAGGRAGGGPPITVSGSDGKEWIFSGEHAIHGVWGQYHNFRAMLDRAEIDPGFVKARKEAWILRQPWGQVQWSEGGSALRSSWIPAPFHYLALFVRPRFLQMLTLRDIASMFRVLAGLLFALGVDPAGKEDRLEGLTLADFFRGWSPTLQALFVGLARNFTSAKPEEVPQAGFIAFLRFYTLLRRDAWAFHYFDRDLGTAVIDPLCARLKSLGGSIHLGAKVTRLERQEDGWRAVWEGGEAHSKTVILALDAPANRELLTQSPDTADLARTMSWPLAVPTVVLRFWFSRLPRGGIAKPEAGIFTGDFVLDNYFWLHRFQQHFEGWSQATGGSAVECHIYGPPDLLKEPDAVLFARGLLDLQRVWPNLRNAMIGQSIRRNPPTHTLFSVGTTEQHLGVETPWTGLFACGDWVRYPHPALYMERATVTGIAAANVILAQNGLATWPIRQPDRPEVLARGVERFLGWVRSMARAYKRRRVKT